GIRDFHVTGVQTCALPISARGALAEFTANTTRRVSALPPIAQAANGPALVRLAKAAAQIDAMSNLLRQDALESDNAPEGTVFSKIGRASCRESGQSGWGAR